MRIAMTILAAASAMTLAACDTKTDGAAAPKSEAARDAAGEL